MAVWIISGWCAHGYAYRYIKGQVFVKTWGHVRTAPGSRFRLEPGSTGTGRLGETGLLSHATDHGGDSRVWYQTPFRVEAHLRRILG